MPRDQGIDVVIGGVSGSEDNWQRVFIRWTVSSSKVILIFSASPKDMVVGIDKVVLRPERASPRR